MRYAAALFLTAILLSLTPEERKVRFTYIKEELEKAKIIAEVSVIGYRDTSLVCYTINDSSLPGCNDHVGAKEYSSCDDGCLVKAAIITKKLPK
jgi:hypothetical protein